MATKTNATCEICNKPYYKCTKCNSTDHYKAFTCSPECYQIRSVLIEWEDEKRVLTDEEAADKLAYLGVTLGNLDKYAGAKNTIRNILEKGSVKADKPKKPKSKLFE